MTLGLKSMGAIGAGTLLVLGISTSGPSSSINTISTPIAPIVDNSKPEVKPKEVRVIAEEPSSKPVTANIVTEKKAITNCHPSYSGCLKMNAGDYDCASGSGNGPNYTDAVQVYGSDPFDLDRDNDGLGCE
ncbi:MAG: hypothetical protein V4668_03780 [Patescibacteria group bacterium]